MNSVIVYSLIVYAVNVETKYYIKHTLLNLINSIYSRISL
eukprot:UN20506